MLAAPFMADKEKTHGSDTSGTVVDSPRGYISQSKRAGRNEYFFFIALTRVVLATPSAAPQKV